MSMIQVSISSGVLQYILVSNQLVEVINKKADNSQQIIRGSTKENAISGRSIYQFLIASPSQEKLVCL
jgi:hypothetical protein